MIRPDQISGYLSTEDQATLTAAEREIDELLRQGYSGLMAPVRIPLTAERLARWNDRILLELCRRYDAGGWAVSREHDLRSGTRALVFKESSSRWVAPAPRGGPPARGTGIGEDG